MRKSTKLKIFRRKKRSVILSVLKRHSLRQHTLARKSELKRVRRERHSMSKKSCKAAESIEDALLRMARVNSNKIHYSSFVPFAYKIDGNRKRCKWLADSSNDRVVS